MSINITKGYEKNIYNEPINVGNFPKVKKAYLVRFYCKFLLRQALNLKRKIFGIKKMRIKFEVKRSLKNKKIEITDPVLFLHAFKIS